MFRRKEKRPPNWTRNPYPWYGYEHITPPGELRRGYRQFERDLKRLDGYNTKEDLDPTYVPILQWMFHNGFLSMYPEADHSWTYYYTGKNYRW